MSGKSNQRLCNKFAIYLLLIIFINKPDAGTIRLDELDLSMMTSGWSVPQKNTSIDGNPIIINEKKIYTWDWNARTQYSFTGSAPKSPAVYRASGD